MTFDILNYLLELASINPSQPGMTPRDTQVNEVTSEDDLALFIASLKSNKDNADILSKLRYRLQLLSVAQNDPGKAEELLSANLSPENGDFPLLDFASWPGVRYAVSGELQTPESEAYFQNISAAAATLRAAIAESERAKGTPAFLILEKILALNSTLPERYKAMANILY